MRADDNSQGTASGYDVGWVYLDGVSTDARYDHTTSRVAVAIEDNEPLDFDDGNPGDGAVTIDITCGDLNPVTNVVLKATGGIELAGRRFDSIYTVGDVVTGGVSIVDEHGLPVVTYHFVAGLYGILYDANDREILGLIEQQTVSYARTTQEYRFAFETSDLIPGPFVIHLSYPDGAEEEIPFLLLDEDEAQRAEQSAQEILDDLVQEAMSDCGVDEWDGSLGTTVSGDRDLVPEADRMDSVECAGEQFVQELQDLSGLLSEGGGGSLGELIGSQISMIEDDRSYQVTISVPKRVTDSAKASASDFKKPG